ncbi:MAG: hypothetical protein LBT09_10325 [Planctomycetaceae bacterium]|jgi:hypothetical protein|nr:hypothetical protein [Planctomycetaceae bacterium]
MNSLIPPVFVSSDSATSPQAQPSAVLIATESGAIYSADACGLLSEGSILPEIVPEVISSDVPLQCGGIVSEIISESIENIVVSDADKILDTIIASTENITENTGQLNTNKSNIENKENSIEYEDKNFADENDNFADENDNNENDNIDEEDNNFADNKINNDNSAINLSEVSINVTKNNTHKSFGKVVRQSFEVGGGDVRSRSVRKCDLSQVDRFHRISSVRVEQGVSLSTAAKRLRLDISVAREQERETSDLCLSQLYAWRDVLEVSVGELILEPEEIPTNPIRNRCQLVRLMKTVRSIIIEAKSEVVLILARQLEAQLIELMPELATIAAWPSLGQARDPQSPGAVATRCMGFGNVYLRRTAKIKNDDEQ